MNVESPASLGFVMPPEWSKQEAIWLSWPHNPATWPGKMEEINRVFARFAAVISLYEKVRSFNQQYKAYYEKYKYKRKWGIVNKFFHIFLLFSITVCQPKSLLL